MSSVYCVLNHLALTVIIYIVIFSLTLASWFSTIPCSFLGAKQDSDIWWIQSVTFVTFEQGMRSDTNFLNPDISMTWSERSRTAYDCKMKVEERRNKTCINSMKLSIPLHSLYWSIHTKDESKRGTAFAFIFGVN